MTDRALKMTQTLLPTGGMGLSPRTCRAQAWQVDQDLGQHLVLAHAFHRAPEAVACGHGGLVLALVGLDDDPGGLDAGGDQHVLGKPQALAAFVRDHGRDAQAARRAQDHGDDDARGPQMFDAAVEDVSGAGTQPAARP